MDEVEKLKAEIERYKKTHADYNDQLHQAFQLRDAAQSKLGLAQSALTKITEYRYSGLWAKVLAQDTLDKLKDK